MPRKTVLAWIMAISASLASGGCDDLNGGGDGGVNGDGGTPTCPGGVDKSVSLQTAVSLEAGKEVEGFICPLRDQDYYKVVMPSDGLLRVELQAYVQATKVELTYLIIKEDGTTVTSAPSSTCLQGRRRAGR